MLTNSTQGISVIKSTKIISFKMEKLHENINEI